MSPHDTDLLYPQSPQLYTNPFNISPQSREDSYWTICFNAMMTGSGINDVVSALRNSPDKFTDAQIADLLCIHLDDDSVQINMPGGSYGRDMPGGWSNAILAVILNVPLAWRIEDPVFYIDPDTGFILNPNNPDDLAKCFWGNSVGGQWCNMAIPFPYSDSTYPGVSYLNSVFWGFFQSPSYIAQLSVGFLNLFEKVQALGLAMVNYAKNQSTNLDINFDLVDMISHVPLTPSQKRFLSQSKFYNPNSESPPCFAEAVIFETMAGIPALVASTDIRADPILTKNGDVYPSAITKNKEAFPAYLATWARQLHEYKKAQVAGRAFMEESLLWPFADAYDPAGK